MNGRAPGLRMAGRLYRLLLTLFPPSYRRENAAELMSFFEDGYAEDFRASGWPGAARRTVRASWDIVNQAGREWRSAGRAAGKRSRLAADLAADIRYAVRSIRRAPGLALVTIVTVGLGVGATSAVFSIVNATLLEPLPYPEPDRLVTVWEANAAMEFQRMQPSYPNFVDIQNGQRSFAALAAMVTQSALLRGQNGAEERRVAFTGLTPAAFDVLGVEPALGRRFLESEALAGRGEVVALLSHRFWLNHFGGDPDVIGRTVDLVGASLTVIGVMPADFAFPDTETEMWIPVSTTGERDGSWSIRAAHMITVIARLAPGVPIERARGDVAGIMAGVQEAHPGEDPAHSAIVLPLDEVLVENVQTALLLLLGAVGVILLIVCVNVANLTLARSVSRGSEMAVRAALGAGRGRLVRQLLAEGVLLAVVAGFVGVVVAAWAIDALVPLIPGSLPRGPEVSIDGTVLAFALVVAVITGLVFSLAPALYSARLDVSAGLRGGDRGSAGTRPIRLRRALVVLEVALSSTLLVGAGLLIGSFWRLLRVDPGFDPGHLITMTVTLTPITMDETVQFFGSLPERLEALPGVERASAVNALPVSGGDSNGSITIEGRTFPEGTAPSAGYRRVLPGYFAAMGIPVLQGRDFDRRDDGTGDFVTIIDASMARRFWPDDSPIGKRIKVGPPDNEPWLTIVGVVGDVHNEGLDRAPVYATYEPHPQRPWTTMNVVVRSTRDPAAVSAEVRRTLLALNPHLAVFGSNTMERRIRDSFTSRRFTMILLGVFASIALLLAVVGIYGVLSYSVTERRREIGIRMALGASGSRLRRAIVTDALWLSLVGIGLGVGLTLALARTLRAFVFEMSVVDPVTIGGVAALLVAVSLGASVVPARRATRVNPVEVLAGE